MIGKLHGTVVDCKNPRDLAKFYAELLGYVVVQSEAEWAVIGDSPDRPGIAFQLIENFKAPAWPSGEVPTQIHFDIRVEDFEVALIEVESLGGKLLSKSSNTFWVCTDPEGHPFCIIKQ
jgi:predicted enzyme related to lactoylglutathione lyase